MRKADVPVKYISIKEAERMGYGSEDRLRHCIKTGELPAYRIGNKFKFKPEDLEKLVSRVEPDEAFG